MLENVYGNVYWRKRYEQCPLRVSKSDKIPEDDSFILPENCHHYEYITSILRLCTQQKKNQTAQA